MPDTPNYSDDELERYFSNPESRDRAASSPPPPSGGNKPHPPAEETARERPTGGVRGFFYDRIRNPKRAQAAFVLSMLAGAVLLVALVIGLYMLSLTDELPPIQQLENPSYELATVAYTADGQVLARYARENRSWATLDEISPHVTNALIATEDHRFYQHWGVDTRGILAAATDAVTELDLRGASTITQQLARNLYDQKIGSEVTVTRKLKEMVTAVALERRYTKREILEMYLNTVPFLYNAFGIEAAAQTYFSVPASELDPEQSATLIGMLRAPSYYNPLKNPKNAQRRRNVVLSLMVKRGYLAADVYAAHRDDPVVTDYQSVELDASLAPYFAEYVRNWMRDWSRKNDHDFYEDGLVVYTTLNAKLQAVADSAVQRQMKRLQAVVGFEWSRSSGYDLGDEADAYVQQTGYTPFEHYWDAKRSTVRSFIQETPHYEHLREQGLSAKEALEQLSQDDAFNDSLRTVKTRLEAGLVSMDPRTGYVKAWVGGRNFTEDKYDHVGLAQRQTGSTFKPFVYTAAIDNGYSPYYTLMDSSFVYRDPETGKVWSPQNSSGSSGQMLTLAQGLAQSKNTITGRVVTELLNADQVAFYARRMGIRQSRLEAVPSLALGTSDVTLLEMASAYSTLANGGLYYPPTVVTRIEDRSGHVLYEAEPAPEEALSEQTAYTVVDMMRGVIDFGTGRRIRWQWGLGDYDLAGKTGTTQESADGWFMLMHPDLVTGAWVGFNDRRVSFRSNFWGQGAHNALFLVGDFFSHAVEADDEEEAAFEISDDDFPLPERYGSGEYTRRDGGGGGSSGGEEEGRVGW